ncbi:MAG: carbohydrate ABC transporter permease [Spirochaetes bacterium]|nr:MAG: carbohydrate ABC transporter permease [Spirochaetota bacterium]
MKKRPLKSLLTLHIPVLIIVFFALAPYIWMFISSITPEKDLYTKIFHYFPEHPTTENYTRIFSKINFASNIKDSLIVAFSTMLLGLGISVTASYSFSRFRFLGRNYLLIQFLVINMFPIVLLLIPLFVIMRFLHILDTHFALIIAYSTFTIPFSTWMMTSFFNAIPREMDESAMVDGCTRFTAMTRIIIPIAMPGIAATGIYIFITAWNEFLYAAILTGNSVKTIPVALQNLIGEYEIAWGLLTAGGVVSAIPVIILFFFIQKRLISGMTAGAVKA